MRAATYAEFGGPIEVGDVREPTVTDGSVIVRVEATGICRSDWHGWQGHDPDITALPHVPGHEFAGEVVAVGNGVSRIPLGMSVIVPFICSCGTCTNCLSGHANVCTEQYQPGFHGWGSFAEKVLIPNADFNVVEMPPSIDYPTAAILGCRVATAYRAVVHQGRVEPDEWLVVHGAGGVGLSAVMIGVAHGSRVVVSDPDPGARDFASSLGASHALDPHGATDLAERIVELTGGGAHVSIDAVGAPGVTATSLRSLRPRGRHVQVGLVTGNTEIPLSLFHSREISLLGSHGMPATDYRAMVHQIVAGAFDPSVLITQHLSLADGVSRLIERNPPPGMAVITEI
ncbi:MAG: alcohol dehydrogenase catalytic domain-containing protein [Acidimicrobiia bacterium]|nr:alcohol dehydrogenase catalytic domain-containing protein [Acidimicrobiia bacterium]